MAEVVRTKVSAMWSSSGLKMFWFHFLFDSAPKREQAEVYGRLASKQECWWLSKNPKSLTFQLFCLFVHIRWNWFQILSFRDKETSELPLQQRAENSKWFCWLAENEISTVNNIPSTYLVKFIFVLVFLLLGKANPSLFLTVSHSSSPFCLTSC